MFISLLHSDSKLLQWTSRQQVRAGGIDPAIPVLAGPVFYQGKNNIPFLQKASNKQSASVIMGLIRLIILSYNR